MKATVLMTVVCVGVCVLSPPELFAEEVLALDLPQAMALALETSEDLKIEENNIGIRKEERKQVRAAILPQVESVTKWSSHFEYPHTGLIDDYDVSSGVTVDQLLFAFGRVSSAIRGAEKYLNISAYQKEATERDILYNAKVAYYTALLARNTHRIVTLSYENAVANKRILEERSATGRVSKKDNIKISSDIATRQPIMYNALVDLKTSMNTLSRIIGVRDQQVELTSDFDMDEQSVHPGRLKDRVLSFEPTLKALEETVRLNEDLVQISKSAFYPEIEAFASWTYEGSDGQAWVDNDAVKQHGIAGIKVTVPIWNGGETFAELAAARYQEKNAELEFERYQNDVLLELDIALTEYQGFVEALVSYEESVHLAEESFKASQDLFSSGQMSTTDLNDAELTLTNERLNLEKTKYFISVSLAKIEKLTAGGQL